MTEFFAEYGLFLLKTVTIVAAIILVIGSAAAASMASAARVPAPGPARHPSPDGGPAGPSFGSGTHVRVSPALRMCGLRAMLPPDATEVQRRGLDPRDQ